MAMSRTDQTRPQQTTTIRKTMRAGFGCLPGIWNIRKLVKQTLEPDQAERLLVKLERLFLEFGIHRPY